MPDRPPFLPLDRVLHLLGAEMDILAALAARGVGALAAAIEGTERPAPGLLSDAQALDELEQRIAGLRTYLERLARAAPPGVALDVAAGLAALTLSAQADRLSGRNGSPRASPALDLF